MEENAVEISHPEHVALLLMGQANSRGKAALTSLSVRIPVWQFLQLDAMAAKASKSRSAMVALVLQAGISAIHSHLDEKTLEELGHLEAEASLSRPQTESGETF